MNLELPAGLQGIDAYGRGIAQAAGQAAVGAGQAGLGMTQSYQNDYQPYDKKLMGFVDHLGSSGYRAAQRGQAMAGVQMQADAQRQAMGRQMLAGGVNMADPRYAFMQGQLAQQAALGKAQAAMASDRSARDEYVKGLGAINAMGLKVGELGNKNLAVASDLARTGLAGMDLGAAAQDRNTGANASAASAAASGQSAAAAGMNAATNAANAANSYQLGLGRLALERYNIDQGNALRQQGIDAANKQNSWGTVIGSQLAGGLTAAGTNWLVNGGLNQVGGWLGNLFGGGSSNSYDSFAPDSGVMTDSAGDFQFDP